jgi:hypothetical protein
MSIKTSNDKKKLDLTKVRIIKKNLVYIIGLTAELAEIKVIFL